MYQETIKPAPFEGFEPMAFSDRVMRLCSARGSELSIRPANLQEAMDALGHARLKLGQLVPDEIVVRALAHNPEIFQLVGKKTEGAHQAFLAFLPLNAEGARTAWHGAADASERAQACCGITFDAPRAIAASARAS